MRTVEIADDVKDILDRHVAAGDAASEADFVAEAARRYAGELEDQTGALLAAAREGIEAIDRRGHITIANEADKDAFWAHINVRVETLVTQLRVEASGAVDPTATEPDV